jgi:hypothetical protein
MAATARVKHRTKALRMAMANFAYFRSAASVIRLWPVFVVFATQCDFDK